LTSIDDAIRLLKEIKDLGGEVSESVATTKTQAKGLAKKAKGLAKKVKRAPSAYNKYMKKELARLKKKHPRTAHAQLFKKAAASWKRSPERKRSMK
jgi:tRNA U34 5-carboxymethylaminomethyl modifying enzyme MnmG/GidA